MSEYFRVLKQIERDDVGERQPPASRLAPTLDRSQASSATGTSSTVAAPPAAPLSPLAVTAYGTLFDNLRALANGRPIRVLVFASVSVEESPRPVITGLAAEALRLGRRVVIAALTESAGRSLLQRRPCESDQATGAGDALPLDFSRPDWQAAFEHWACDAAADADLVIIEGRPLGQSIDAALLARACDGLVLVARTEVTPRQTLQAAAERARAVGCRTLGVVMHGPTSWMPAWLRRATGGGARPLITPKSSQTSP
jgi:hypothetical protein